MHQCQLFSKRRLSTAACSFEQTFWSVAPGGSFRLIEVKLATGPKPHYAYGIGIQKHVLLSAEIKLEGTRLMHLNRDHLFDGREYDVSH